MSSKILEQQMGTESQLEKEVWKVACTVTIDPSGVAEIDLHSHFGRKPGEEIPLRSKVTGEFYGKIVVREVPEKNGHAII